MTGADLAGAYLIGANLTDADLGGADLSSADLYLASGTPRTHASAVYVGTRCPNGGLKDTDCWAP